MGKIQDAINTALNLSSTTVQVTSFTTTHNLTGGSGICKLELNTAQGRRVIQGPNSESCFAKLNQHIAYGLPQLARTKGSSSHAPTTFSPFNRNWIGVDADRNGQFEAFLYQPGNHKGELIETHQIDIQKFSNLLQILRKLENSTDIEAKKRASQLKAVLATKSWQELGLRLDASGFMAHSPVFKMQSSPTDQGMPFPFAPVTLQNHPEIRMDASNSYLWSEWNSYVQKNGVTCTAVGKDTVRYEKDGLNFMEVQREPNKMTATLFSPLGEKIRTMTIPLPGKEPVQVFLPQKPGDARHSLVVYGTRLDVEAYFDAKLSTQERVKTLQKLGQEIQKFPRSFVQLLLEGRGQERPLRLQYMSLHKARQLGLENRSVGGHYNPNTNTLLLNAEDNAETHLCHEMGHALADALIATDDYEAITSPERSALPRYYQWRMRQALTPAEFDQYASLAKRYRAEKLSLHPNPNTVQELKDQLKPFWAKLSPFFVSPYAADDAMGPDAAVEQGPQEDFAEIVNSTLNRSENSSDGDPHPVLAWNSQDPLGRLIGIQSLFEEHPEVGWIGPVTRGRVFHEETFKTVLGIDLRHTPNSK